MALNLSNFIQMRYIYILLFFTIFIGSYAQEDSDEVYDNEDDFIAEQEAKKNWKNKFYLGITNTFYIDYVLSPLGTTNFITYDPDPNGGPSVPVNNPAAAQTDYQSVYSFGIEPRYNIIDFEDNLALAISAPITIGLGTSGPASDEVQGSSGFGNFQMPLLLHIYYGTGSTYYAQDDFGINIGAGFELNKLGLFTIASTEEERNMNKAWIMPAVTAGVHFYRGSSPMEVNIKYGFGPIENQIIDGFGNRLKSRRVTRATSLKLSFIYLLNQ